MNAKDLPSWAALHHYPQLILDEQDVVRHGKCAWKRLLRCQDRVEKALRRIEAFEERVQREEEGA